MELTQLQISEILSNYTSSSEGFVTLQSLIINSLMKHERDLFVNENAHEQCNGFRSRRWYSHGFYIDATFIATRRDKQVSKEAYYTILGVLEDGS